MRSRGLSYQARSAAARSFRISLFFSILFVSVFRLALLALSFHFRMFLAFFVLLAIMISPLCTPYGLESLLYNPSSGEMSTSQFMRISSAASATDRERYR